jgi:DnaA-homolog protein
MWEIAMSEQLTLGMALKAQHTFERFIVGSNQELLFMLQNLNHSFIDKGLYLWGEAGAGRTHLLQACCHAYSAQGRAVMYLSAATADPACLESLTHLSLIALDDVELVIGDARWERALYCLYNQLTEGTCLLITSSLPVAKLPVMLPDLRSRMSALVCYQVHGVNDVDKRAVLKAQAMDRGLRLSDQVLDYLFVHYDRGMVNQIAILDKLDHLSMVHKRAITIPLIKSVFPVAEK